MKKHKRELNDFQKWLVARIVKYYHGLHVSGYTEYYYNAHVIYNRLEPGGA